MPNNWKTYKLGDIAKLRKEGIKPSDFNDEKYLGLEHIGQGNFLLDGIGKASDVASNKSKFVEGDILYGKIRPYFKKVYRPKFSGICSTDILIISTKNESLVSQSYLYQFIKTQEFTDKATETSSGTKMPRADWNSLKQWKIPFPPLKGQTQIANILSAIDDKIENNLATNKTLEDMSMALYKHWFVDFGPFQDGEFIDSELGLIPKGWEVKKFNDLIEKIIDNRGKTPPLSKEKTDFLLLETYQLSRDSLFPNEIKENKAKYISEETYNNLKWFRKGHPQFMDILFATVGNGIPNWSVMYENDGVGIAQNVVAIRPKSNISSSFLRYSFESQLFLGQFDGYVITTAQPSIKLSDLNMIDMILPKQEIMDKWNRIVDEYVDQVYINYKENKTLTKLRDTLLPKLISGEVHLKEFREEVKNVITNAVK